MGLIAFSGCMTPRQTDIGPTWEDDPSYRFPVETQIEYPAVRSNLEPQVANTSRPLSLENPADIPTFDLELNDAIEMALSNSEILRSLGGSVVQNPLGTQTKFEPARAASDPLAGPEAALSAFDAQVAGGLLWRKIDRPANRAFAGIGALFPSLDAGTVSVFDYSISKIAANGAQFALRHDVEYNRDDVPGATGRRIYPSGFLGGLQAEYRQPLMQGAGIEFNRIAGPNAQPGQYNGVLIARINTDVSLTDFEAGVINFVNDVETAYWALYFAYHDLEARVAGRNSSLLTWQRIKELQKVGARGGDAAAEAQARANYYNFDVQVKESLTGELGLYTLEQQLRYLLGMPATDGRLIKPVTQPMEGEVVYDWDAAIRDALTRRVEIRKQKWAIKRRELELIAARLNRRPRLDFVGNYRFTGLGDHWINSRQPDRNSFANQRESNVSMYQDIFSGDFQEWQAGFELSYPVGFRRASAAVANAQWNLARENAVLREQELRISHDLSSAARRIRRAYALTLANFSRQAADRDQVVALQARYESGLDNINFLLQAQQQLANSQSAYFRSLVDYQLALKDFHREKGSLLNYNQVGLSEGAWPSAAYQDAVERGRFFRPRSHPEQVEAPPPASNGAFDPTAVGANLQVPAEYAPEAELVEPAEDEMPLDNQDGSREAARRED
jgi:outer membrane protein TolC